MPKREPKNQRQKTFLDSPPHSTEAEQVVLGAFLLDSERAVELSSLLAPEDFYDPTYRAVFEGIVACIKEYKAVDFVILVNHLSENKRVSDVGGSAFLAQLAASVPTSAHAAHYIKILKKKRVEREAIAIGRRVEARGHEEGKAKDIPQILIEESRKLSELLPREALMNRDEILHEIKNPGKKLQTGFLTMDMILSGGLGAGDLMLVAARPSVGKSSLATTLTSNFMKKGIRPCFFSLEMSRPQIVTRILCAHYNLTPEEVYIDAERLLKDLTGDVDLIFGTNDLSTIQTTALSSEAQVFIIDYFGLITANNIKENRFQIMDEISRSIKLLATHTGKPIIMLTQLNREIEKAKENREPQLSDLWGGGEKDADIISFLWDPNAKNIDNQPKTDAERQVAKVADEFEGKPSTYDAKSQVFGSEVKDIMWLTRKNRNGPCGNVALTFDPKRCLMTEKSYTPEVKQAGMPF